MNPILIFILILGSLLRLYRLSSLPISLFGDEVDVGYQAWSLITTGRDYFGNLFPTYLHSLSEWRAPLLMYLTAPFVGLLSPSVLSVRLPVALMGILNIYLIYHLANKLFPNKKLAAGSCQLTAGHFAALILALTPWHIHYSRAAFEVTLLTTLILSGIIFYLSRKYFLAFVFFVLTFYTYSIANLFVPLLILLLLFFFRPAKIHFSRANFFKSVIILILLLPIGYHLTIGAAAGRFKQISLTNDHKIIEDVILQRTAPWVVGSQLEVLFHNKFIGFVSALGRSYLTAFSTDFLFINGDPNFRQSVSRFGQLLWVSIPFLILGFARLIGKKDPASRFLLALLLISPLGGILTQGGGNHATRLFVMLPALVTISALGLEPLFSERPAIKRILVPLLIALTIINVLGYWYRYEFHYRFESAKVWNYGHESAFTKLAALDNSQGRVFVNNTYEPSLLRFVFFTRFSPALFQQNFAGDVPVDNLLPHFTGFRFGDRYFFGQIDRYENLPSLLAPGDLYLAVQGKEIPGDWDWGKNPPEGMKSLSTTYNVYGLPLMYILEKTN